MSASPKEPTAQSQKRPLEDPSSPAGPTDQPDAKRPALDILKEDGDTNDSASNVAVAATPVDDTAVKQEEVTPVVNGSSVVPAASEAPAGLPSANQVLNTQPAQAAAASGAEAASAAASAPHHADESQWLHLRCIISSAEAATVIGKGGENVKLIRQLSGAKCTVSDYSRGAVERILTVSGLVDAVAKAFGLIIRTLNNEPLEEASTPQSKTYPLRLLVPHILIGSIIGKQGVRIREIQDASGARLNASDQCLPLSTERSLVVLGVADAVHIATFYVGKTLDEQLTERFGGPASSAYATRSGGPAGVVPGGMQVVPYVPHQAGGQWGQPEYFRRQQAQRGPPQAAYGGQYPQSGAPIHSQPSMGYGAAASPRAPYAGAGPQAPAAYSGHASQPHVGHAGAPQHGAGVPGQPLTQQIFIPNDMVGAIIGKGGAKINEIRQLSGSVIKINEPQDNSNERLVTITGTGECNQMALYMLYSRLGMLTSPITSTHADKALKVKFRPDKSSDVDMRNRQWQFNNDVEWNVYKDSSSLNYTFSVSPQSMDISAKTEPTNSMLTGPDSTMRRIINARRTNIDGPTTIDNTNAMEVDHPSLPCESEGPPARRLRTEPTPQYPTAKGAFRANIGRYHDMAVVIVGPKESKFTLHKDLLIAVSPFFAAALNGHFSESDTQIVRLPEERPEIFEWFAQWIYTGSLSVSSDCTTHPHFDTSWTKKPTHNDGDLRNSAGSPKYFLLIDIYALSDRLGTTTLSNHIINTIARLSEQTNSVPTPSDTWLLYGDCASHTNLHHCACRTSSPTPRSSTGLPTPCPSLTAPKSVTATGPIKGPNEGIRPSAPIRELILDLFTYKKTDRLLDTHKDDWHPLFLRDLVVRLKRPGTDALSRHSLKPWLPADWEGAMACVVCRRVVGPGGAVGEERRGGRAGGLESGDAGWALVGGDLGGCKPWLGWDEGVLDGDKGWGKKGKRRGVCGRYHEHGPLG
ncbi:hypothetical protein K461DRAFT_285233 [Myriangium duriaei CBS 260.36]|uniref:BTB domain-containing protein n=1 Tax=Myriangium duriaei CBS 260.36 TaxID=1168546 RepID=A0A9P4MHS9_9PEZI|nr:hypothetical protein K461DRAFT_285233 [Myriangium duriaei CBS 260.36]